MILKNICPHISEIEVENDLINQKLNPTRVKQMVKKVVNENANNEIKLPMFVINFAPSTQKSDICNYLG